MERIYLEMIQNLLITGKLTLEEFYNYIETLFKADKMVCFYDSEFTKNANVCFNNFAQFKTWFDTVEAKKETLLSNIAASKIIVETVVVPEVAIAVKEEPKKEIKEEIIPEL